VFSSLQNTKKGETEEIKADRKKVIQKFPHKFLFRAMESQSCSRSASHITQSRFVLFLMPKMPSHMTDIYVTFAATLREQFKTNYYSYTSCDSAKCVFC
jgi:hypothetical protein